MSNVKATNLIIILNKIHPAEGYPSTYYSNAIAGQSGPNDRAQRPLENRESQLLLIDVRQKYRPTYFPLHLLDDSSLQANYPVPSRLGVG